jgi:uncharacterized protein (DUF885 family)
MGGTKDLREWRTICRSGPAPDYDSYLTRIEQYPRLNDQALAITGEAVRSGHVLPCSVLTGYERSIGGVIAEDVTKSRFYGPFTRPRPATIPKRSGPSSRSGRGGSSPPP